jgi:hypothetical protein
MELLYLLVGYFGTCGALIATWVMEVKKMLMNF